MRMNLGKCAKYSSLAVLVLAAGAIDARDASAGSVKLYLRLPGVADLVDVAGVTGGVFVPAKTAPATAGHPAVSTASYTTPVVITTSEPQLPLLRYAVQVLYAPNPNVIQTDLELTGFQHNASSVSATAETMVQHQRFSHALPTRIDFPGTFGPSSTHGSFSVTANVAQSSSEPLATGDSGGPNTTSGGPLVLNAFVFQAHDLAGATKEPPEGYFTFEPFSVTQSMLSTAGFAITLHSTKVSLAEITSWANAHPTSSAKLMWRRINGGSATTVYTLDMSGVSVVSSSNDSTGAAAITVHLNAQRVGLTLN